MYSITEAAKRLAVSPHTLRYYEKEGIIEPDRTSSGKRSYQDVHIDWLRFVIKLRETQMPIANIKAYTELFKEGNHTKRERLTTLEEHKQNIQEQIETLSSTNEMLAKKIASYKELISGDHCEREARRKM
ncbi:MerR family transcriptional regulator [Halobacillus sp. BBL2006]|uniref:MerR family transcriptional regulator n=1 Tax=Halobacillus sp. BBL2006 TaxID=1543706 RepID=UPI0005422840|nr:MerR family transcriptional regulator [Halobacillus sp. BBL2006]KHE67020.1 MerR family transcriptional regulator [Halobacillus sp. BBL2006]